MDHIHVQAKLRAFVDNGLRSRERDEIAMHLMYCPECSEELANLDKKRAGLEAAAEMRADKSFIKICPKSSLKKLPD